MQHVQIWIPNSYCTTALFLKDATAHPIAQAPNLEFTQLALSLTSHVVFMLKIC